MNSIFMMKNWKIKEEKETYMELAPSTCSLAHDPQTMEYGNGKTPCQNLPCRESVLLIQCLI
jgi:hypothetical protein